MAATITMPTEPIEVAPGASTAFTVTVRNIGSVVDMIVVEVLGDAAPWATVTPSAVSLFPATDSTVAVSITVPRDSRIAAGSVPVAVRASARDQPGPATEETTLEILPFADAAIFLAPTVSKGSRKGSHELSVDNLGNVALQATLSALCDDADVRIEPATLLVEPGQQGNAAVTVVPEKRFSRGPSVTHAFTLVVEPEGGLALSTPGSMLQEATVPRWVFKAALLLLVLAIALPLLWFALLKPTVRSTAKDAAIEEITAATAPVTIGATGGQNADPSKGGAKGGAGAGTGGATVGGAGAATTVAGGGTSTGGTAGTGAGTGVGGAGGVGGVGTLQPIDGRLFLTAAGSTSFTVPAARVLQVTDIVLQNPASNTGSIQIKRGDDVLLDVALENFRDLDYHFVTPLTFTPGQKLTLAAACTSSGCTPSSLFSGTLATSS